MKGYVLTSFTDLLILFLSALCVIISLAEYAEENRVLMDLPKAEGADNPGMSRVEEVTISIKQGVRGCRYFYEDSPTTREGALALVKRASPASVILRAEKEITYQEIFWIIHQLKKADVSNISFAYQEEEK